MSNEQIEQVRSFNRVVSQRIGALEANYLGRGRPLGQARLLFEIGEKGSDLRLLRERLGLDSGYLSRLVSSLQKQDLIALSVDAGDRRRRRATLTAKGLEERAAYDTLSHGLAASLLRPLNETQRARLTNAMKEIKILLTAASVTIDDVSAASAEARACLTAYFDELAMRFENGFDPDAGTSADQPAAPLAFLVARHQGEPVGCGALYRLDGKSAEIKRMWVAPRSRGLGLARRLLAALEAKARDHGFSRLCLDTNRALGEAQSLYRRSGYHEIARYSDNPYADFWFEKTL